MEIKKLTEDAALHLMKARKFGDQRFALLEQPEGLLVTFETNKDGSGAIFGLDVELYETIVDTMTTRTLEMVNDLNQVVTEQGVVCDRMEADGKQGVRPDVDHVDSISIQGVVYGGFYPAEGVEHHVGDDTPVESSTHYTQMVTFSAYNMEINGEAVDFYTMAAMCMSYGIPVCPTLFFGSFDEALSTHTMLKDHPSIIPAMAPLLDGECEPILKDEQLQSLPQLEGNKHYQHILRTTEPTFIGYLM